MPTAVPYEFLKSWETFPVTNRYVACFDILGMTQAMLTNPTWAMRFLHCFNEAVKHASERGLVLESERRQIPDRLFYYGFSDSLFIFSMADTTDDLYNIILRSALIMEAAISHRVPLRAAVSVGPMIIDLDNHFYAGPPLVRAHQSSETSDWLGIELEADVADRATALELGTALGPSLLLPWQVPTNSNGHRASTVINWPALHYLFTQKAQDAGAKALSSLEQFYSILFLKEDLASLPPTVRAKYQNTFDFVRHALKGRKSATANS